VLSERKDVYFVDDDENDRFLFEQAWRQAAIRNPLVSFEDGARVLEALSGNRPLPAFVILDVKMPGPSGFDVLRKLKADPKLRGLPVLMLTASTSPPDVAVAYRLGANGFIIKPSSLRELVELLTGLKGWWLRFNEFPDL
jgi:CheY-like chemotaxis protein